MSVPSSFCILPWISLATSPSGTLRLCCNSTPGENVIKKSDGRPYRVFRDDLKDAWNSESYREFRRALMTKSPPSACRRCFREEESGVTSSRQAYNQAFHKHVDQALARTALDGSVPFEIRYFDLRVGNLCNLRCRMCGPYSSDKWVEEWREIGSLSENELNRLAKMDWSSDPGLWERIDPLLASIEEIYLTGGEPLLWDRHEEFLRRCVSLGFADRITLKYNTNATVFPPALLELWPHFAGLRLHLSVDAFGDLNSYIRHPSKWNVIDRNLRMIDSWAGTDPRFEFTVHTTVQAFNILHLAELFDYMREFRRIDPFPHLNILNQPNHLNVRVLSKDLKELAEARLQPYLSRASTAGVTALRADAPSPERVHDLITYMRSEDWSQHLPRFIEETAKLDRMRGQNVVQVVPEFAMLFSAQA